MKTQKINKKSYSKKVKLSSKITTEQMNTICDKVVNWNLWCSENGYGSKFDKVEVGHISSNKMSVKCVTGDVVIYYNLEKWYVSGILKGKNYNFSKKCISSVE